MDRSGFLMKILQQTTEALSRTRQPHLERIPAHAQDGCDIPQTTFLEVIQMHHGTVLPRQLPQSILNPPRRPVVVLVVGRLVVWAWSVILHLRRGARPETPPRAPP